MAGHHGGALSMVLVAAAEGGSRLTDYRIWAGDCALIPSHLPHALQDIGMDRLVCSVVTVPL